jgi:hypothetical protein
VALFEGFGVVTFAPATYSGPEPCRDEVTGEGSAGRVGVQDVLDEGGRSAGLSPSVSSAMILACCQEMVPAHSASIARGREQSCRAWVRSAPAAAALMVRTPAISSMADISA